MRLKHLRLLTALLCLILTATAASAADTDGNKAVNSFIDAPQHVFPLLDRNTRMDMVDYFNSSLPTSSTNLLDGKSRITAVTPSTVRIEMTGASDYDLILLPSGKDTLIAVITTVKSPAPDSRLDIYSSAWHQLPTQNVFAKPSLKDWLTDDGKKHTDDVDAFVPFVLISYTYDPTTQTLTLTNNTKEFFSPDVYEIVGGFLQAQKSYKWTGKKFQLQN